MCTVKLLLLGLQGHVNIHATQKWSEGGGEREKEREQGEGVGDGERERKGTDRESGEVERGGRERRREREREITCTQHVVAHRHNDSSQGGNNYVEYLNLE